MLRLTDEQLSIARDIYRRPFCALWADMGAGKTAITLRVIKALIDEKAIDRVVVVAPRAVADNTWKDEASRWYGEDIIVQVVKGTPSKRAGQVKSLAHVFCVGRDSVARKYGRRIMPSDDLLAIVGDNPRRVMLVLDEASSFKNPTSNRFRALARIHFGRVIELTGTPCAQSLADVWSQIYLLDRGAALGENITSFRRAFMTPILCSSFVKWKLKLGAESEILDRIKHLVIRCSVDAPCDVEFIDVHVKMGTKAMRAYSLFKKEAVLALESEKEVSAASAGALVQKLAAFASGAVYTDEKGSFERVHASKIAALTKILRESSGGVLVFYWFKFSIDDIAEAARKAGKSFEAFNPSIKGQVERWNEGGVDVLAAHPQSAGMGLNLQHGGCIEVWYTVTWSAELWLQAVARLARRGQKSAVKVYKLISEGTIDEKISESCGKKIDNQSLILDALNMTK